MKFLQFYRKHVSKHITKVQLQNFLNMQRIIEQEKNRKMYVFSITSNNHLLSHPTVNKITIFEELRKEHRVVLASNIAPLKKLLISEICEEGKLKITEIIKDDIFWIFSMQK